MKTVRFILAIHNHQPVGNFDHVFEKACRRAYHPFLDAMDEFGEIRFVLHCSGPLLEWAEKNDRELADRIVEGARKGRFELLGGGFGEPILTMLPDHDVVGQIVEFREHLRRRYGVRPRGIWLSERVWEASLAALLAEAGIEYTVVDDFHFKAVGLREEELCGYYLTEDRGRLLRIFSGSEQLRYAIPFREPEATIEYLRRFATDDGRNVVVYADDGEKFGIWPETYEHVYERGWLRKWLKILNDNRDWITFTTFAETVDSVPPRGRIYLADASYREMTEWALPAEVQIKLAEILEELKSAGLLERARSFMRGGTWRNFKAKYVEAAQMYARMMEVSRLVASRSAAKNAEEARRALYRGQCNCAYWHGVFGGLYLPFLRFAVYNQLIKAENLIAQRRDQPAREMSDFDLDGRPEVKLHNSYLCCYVKPDRGGSLYELDDRAGEWNLTSVMTRRLEASHHRLVEAVRAGKACVVKQGEGVKSIHDLVRCKEAGLEKLLQYDSLVRECLIDHFYPVETRPEALRRSETSEWGDFAGAAYQLIAPASRAATITLTRRGAAGPTGHRTQVDLAKRLILGKDSVLEIRYVLGLPEGAPPNTVFAVEFNFGLMAGQAMDRNFFSGARENLGNLSTSLEHGPDSALGLVDEFLGVEIWLRADPAARYWTYPVETVNDSEGGFERVYQGSAVLPFWKLDGRPGEERIFSLTLEVRHR